MTMTKMTVENRIRKVIEGHRAIHDERRKNKKIVFDNPYSLDIEGGMSSGGRGKGRLAASIEKNNIKAKFGVRDPDTSETLTEEIDLKDIQTFTVSVSAGDIVQAEFKTFHGDWVRCPVSEFKVSLDGMKGTEFNIGKYKKDRLDDKNDTEEVTK